MLENAGMDYENWLWIKLIGLGVLSFFGNFFYTLFTGRTIEQERSGQSSGERSD